MMASIIKRNRTKCIICYSPHSSLENGPGVQRQFAESSGLLQRVLDIKFPTSFNEYGEISICKPCFDGQFQEAEVLYGRLIEIENEFKSKGYNIATKVIDSVYKSGFLNQNPNGNAFDSIRYLAFQKWLRFYTRDKKIAAAAAASKESNVGLEKMDVGNDNVEDDEVTITYESTPETATALNESKSIQSDTNSLVDGKLEKIVTANTSCISTSSMTTEEDDSENEKSIEVADDSDSGYKNPNSIVAPVNDTCVKNQDQQQIEPNVPTTTTTTTTMNKSNEPLASGKEVIFVKRSNPLNQKVVGHPSTSARRPQVQEEYSSRAKFALKPVTFLGLDLDKFKRKKLIYMVRDQGTGELKIEHRKPPTITNNINHLDLIKKRKLFTLVRDNKVGKIIPKRLLDSINKGVQALSSSVQVLSREPTPPLLSRFDVSSDSDHEVGEVSSKDGSVSDGSKLNRHKNPAVAKQTQANQVHKRKQDQVGQGQGQDSQSEEISPTTEVKRSKRIIKKPMHYDEHNYIYDYDLTGNGKEMDKLIDQEGRKLKEQKEAAGSSKVNRSVSVLDRSPEELEADDEDKAEETEMEEVTCEQDNPVDREENQLDSNGPGQEQRTRERRELLSLGNIKALFNMHNIECSTGRLENWTNEFNGEMNEEKLELKKFKCVFCTKFFSTMEMKMEHEMLHANF